MSKEHVQKMSGVLVSVFAHTGHITKEDAREISGLDEGAFEKAYDKAANIFDKIMKVEGNKMDKFLEHFGEEIEEHAKEMDIIF